jgi:surfeit locus 1 family protein
MLTALVNRLRCYRFEWKLSLFAAVLLPLLISLGVWQLRRADEKIVLQAQYDARQQQAPIALSEIYLNVDQQYRQVSVSGSVDQAHVFLLDNRTYQGKVGYEVLVPLALSNGQRVLLNRGWIKGGASRADLPAVPAMSADVSVQGAIYQNVGEAFVLGEDATSATWPQVIQTLDYARIAMLLELSATELLPYSIRLAEQQPGVLTRYWSVINTTPEKHQGYAVQWFAMALAVVMLYFYYSTKAHT